MSDLVSFEFATLLRLPTTLSDSVEPSTVVPLPSETVGPIVEFVIVTSSSM